MDAQETELFLLRISRAVASTRLGVIDANKVYDEISPWYEARSDKEFSRQVMENALQSLTSGSREKGFLRNVIADTTLISERMAAKSKPKDTPRTTGTPSDGTQQARSKRAPSYRRTARK